MNTPSDAQPTDILHGELIVALTEILRVSADDLLELQSLEGPPRRHQEPEAGAPGPGTREAPQA